MPIQAPQWTEFLSCPICCNMFNENCHRPISLGCGHTVCKNCLGKLQHKKCPFDSNVISRDLDELPINFALLQLVGVAVPDTENDPNGTNLAENIQFYKASKRCIEELAIFLKPVSTGLAGATTTLLSRPMQRKLVTLVNCQLIEEEGRARAMRSARSLGERTVTEFILAHQNPTQLSANLWAAVRARGCQFLGPAMQEEVLKLILLALEDGSALSRKVLVLFVVQRLETQYPQASKTAIGHVVQLLYRASCFKVTKREEESSLMQLKEEFRTYEMLRREHDSQIVQIATEAGLRIAPDQWSSLLYGDSAHKSHMQSIIDKLQTPQSMTQSITELMMALQRTGDPASLARLQPHFDLLANIDPSPDVPPPLWENLQAVMKAVKTVVQSFASFISSSHHSKVETSSVQNNKYKTSMCRDLMQRNKCPRGPNCTFAHSEEEMERYRNKTKKLGSGIPNVGKVNPIQSMSSMQTTPSVLMTMQDQELDFALRQEMRTPTPDIYCSTFDDLSSESDMRRFPLSCSVTSLPMAQASQMSLYTSPISLPRDRTNKALLCKPRVSSFEIPTNPSEHEHEANLYGISQYQQVVQATGVPETHGTVYREASPSVLYDLSAPAAVYYEPVQHAPRYVKMVKPIPNPLYVSAEERQLKRATALPPNPYTMKRCQVEPREAAAYPDGLSYSKLPMQTLGELHHRRDELLAQLNKTASSPPSVNQAPHLVDKERSPPSSMPLKIVKSVADSVAITHVTASLAKQKDDVKPTVYHEQLKNADHIGAYIAWTSSAMAVNHPSPSPSPPPPPSTQSQTTHNREHPTNGELNEDQIPVCAPYEELEIPIEMPIVEEEVFVCNSEETNDEFVPFSHTVVSKYGPISRMAKARVKQAAPVQVTAAQGKTVTPVTAVTPTSRPFPITSPVPSRFFPVNDYHPVREEHTHKPSPQGVNVAASLPSAHLKTLLTAGSGASSNMEPYQLWAVNKERANSPSVKPVSEREQIRHELARLGQQIQNLQMSEDGRLARELQSVELSIRETERKMQITERSSTSISSQEENRNATIAIQLQAEQELEIQQRTQERFRVETTAEKAAREKLLQERRDRQLAEQLVVDEARQKGIHLMPGQVVGMSVNPNQHGY